jgi:hypothetical protein
MRPTPYNHSPVPWSYRALLILALCVHASIFTSRPVGFWQRFTFDSVATQGRKGWDFFAIYQAGHNALTGVSVYESDNDKIDVVAPLYTPYRYLPFLATTLGVLLNALPPVTALKLWMVISEAIYVLCIVLAWRRAKGGARGATVAIVWLLFTPYYLELYLGQFNVAQAALLLVMLLQVGHASPAWPQGLAWGASLLLKPHSGLLAPALLRARRWRVLGIGAAVVLVTSAPYMMLHPTAVGAFMRNFSASAPAPQLGNLGARQLLFSTLSALEPALSPAAHVAAQNLWVALVLVMALGLTFLPRRVDLLELSCFWLATYFLLYHHVWEHHYILLLPVFTVLYLRLGAWPTLAFYLPIALWTPYLLIDPGGRAAIDESMRWTFLEPRWVDVLYHASKALPALLLWIYLAYRLWRHPEVTPSSSAPPLSSASGTGKW